MARGGTSHPSKRVRKTPIVESSSVRPSGPRVQGLCRRLGYQEDEAFGPFPGRKVGQQHNHHRLLGVFWLLVVFFGILRFVLERWFWSLSFFLVLSQFLCIFFFWHLIDPHSFPSKLGKKTKLFVFIFCKSEIYQSFKHVFVDSLAVFFSMFFVSLSRLAQGGAF